MFSLHKRRIRGDIIQTFKFIKGIDKIKAAFFKPSIFSGTRGHKLKLYKSRARLRIRQNFFSQRVINMWNKLPESVISCSSVKDFKKGLDETSVFRSLI